MTLSLVYKSRNLCCPREKSQDLGENPFLLLSLYITATTKHSGPGFFAHAIVKEGS